MRILIATGLYHPDIGGPATYTKFLERHLSLHGHELTVVSFGTVRRYPRGIRHMLYVWKLFKYARTAECIYALDTISVGIPACVVSAIWRTPFYLRVPGDYAWEQGQQRFGITDTLDVYLESKKHPWMVTVLAWLQYRVATYAQKIIVPSEYMKGVVVKWGVPKKKIIRIYSALNPIHIHETKEQLREQFGYDGFVVSTAARLVPWKGIETLIQVVKELRERGVHCFLEIIGEGNLYAHLHECIRISDADQYIFLRGKLDTQELAKRIKASDVFVLNTSYEGLSHQLLEVMAIGTPIVTTPVGGNTELITDTIEGLLVPVNDREVLINSLNTLREDQELVAKLTQNARKKVALFHEQVIIPEIVTLFSK